MSKLAFVRGRRNTISRTYEGALLGPSVRRIQLRMRSCQSTRRRSFAQEVRELLLYPSAWRGSGGARSNFSFFVVRLRAISTLRGFGDGGRFAFQTSLRTGRDDSAARAQAQRADGKHHRANRADQPEAQRIRYA